MSNILFRTQASGVFGGLFQCGIQALVDVEFDNICLKMKKFDKDWEYTKYLSKTNYTDVYDYILDQQYDDTYKEYTAECNVPKVYDGIYNRIENSPRLSKYREILSKIKFKKDIIAHSSMFPIVSEETLGVHVRMCMEYEYKYGSVTFDSYVKTIDSALENHNYKSIFVASDNNETLSQLEAMYPGKICYYANFDRLPSDKPTHENNMHSTPTFLDERIVREAMLEALTLAKCDSLVCKTSNLGNFAIVAGNHKSIYRVPATLGGKLLYAK